MSDQLILRHPRADTLPNFWVFAGDNDPSGGSGLQADIEAAISMGCPPAPVITAIVAQDTVL